MIKTTVEYVPSYVGANYPYYGQAATGNIVLFVKESCGIAIKKVDGNIKGHEYREDWHEDMFTPINVVEVVLKVVE